MRITKEQKEEMQKLRDQGFSYNDISLKLGIKLNTVYYNLNEEYKEKESF